MLSPGAWGPPSVNPAFPPAPPCPPVQEDACPPCPYSRLRLLVTLFSEVSDLGGGCREGIKPGPAHCLRTPGLLGRQDGVPSVCKSACRRGAPWVARLVGSGLMSEAVESLCLQALPPASFHGASRAVCLGKHPCGPSLLVEAHWQLPLAPESPAPTPFRQPLPLPEPEFPAPRITRRPARPSRLVPPFWPWHFLLLLSGRPFSSPRTW